MASIKPAEAREHARRLAARRRASPGRPVSGGTVGAEAGTLAIMAGGEAADFERAAPVFAALGRATHVGPHGAGQLAKLANQMIVGITIGAVAEALLLCEKGGADPAKVRQAIGGGFAESRILQLHGERMVTRDFAPRGRMTVQRKTCATRWTPPPAWASTPPSPPRWSACTPTAWRTATASWTTRACSSSWPAATR
jgi:2-hydroxy-3-oxopropionate reductase